MMPVLFAALGDAEPREKYGYKRREPAEECEGQIDCRCNSKNGCLRRAAGVPRYEHACGRCSIFERAAQQTGVISLALESRVEHLAGNNNRHILVTRCEVE